MKCSRQKFLHPRGFTMVELLMALMILALITTAVTTMTFGAMNTDRFLRSTNTAQAEAELAMRRIAFNLRTAQTGSITISGTTLTTLSQPDSANNAPNGATVVYSLRTNPTNANQKQLMENDARFGGLNVLANNVSTFTITPVSGIANLYRVDLIIASSPIVERHFNISCRN